MTRIWLSLLCVLTVTLYGDCGMCRTCPSGTHVAASSGMGARSATEGNMTLAYMITRSGVYTTFEKAMRKAGFLTGRDTPVLPQLRSHLFLQKDDLRAITLLIPHDRAFEDLPDYLRWQIFSDKDILRDVILYHAIDGRYREKDFTSGVYTTLLGKQLRIQRTETDDIVINGKSRLLASNIRVDDGIIHTINAVLLP